jgi:hypothetical protein
MTKRNVLNVGILFTETLDKMARKKFEYLTFQTSLSDRRLNELGGCGWELVSHTAVVGLVGFGQYYIFKREIL